MKMELLEMSVVSKENIKSLNWLLTLEKEESLCKRGVNINYSELKQDISAFTDEVNSKQETYLHLACLNGIPIGYSLGALVKINDLESQKLVNAFNSQGIYVVNNMRNRGFGFQIKEFQKELATTLGCSYSISKVNASNIPSIKLLKKSGHVITETGNKKIYDVRCSL